MTIYLITIFLSVVIAYNGSRSCRWYENLDGTIEGKISWGAIVTLLILWVAVFSLRGISVGTDTSGYYFYYKQLYGSSLSLQDYINSSRDQLFGLVEYLCCQLFNGSWVAFQAVLGTLIFLPLLLVMRRRPDYFVASVMLFFFGCFFYSGMNGVRQTIAESIVIWAYYNFLLKKKYIKFSVLIIIAFSFHSSVIFAIPILVISLFDIDSAIVKISSALMIFSFVFLWNQWAYLISFLEAIGQTKMANDYAEVSAGNGSSYLRFFVYFLPFLLGYINRGKLKLVFKEYNNELILNLFGALLMLLSVKFWVLGRAAGYLTVSLMFFVPKLFESFSENGRQLAKFLILGIYFAFMTVILLSGEGSCYPYVFLQYIN